LEIIGFGSPLDKASFFPRPQGRIDFHTVDPSLLTGKDFPVERLIMKECTYSTIPPSFWWSIGYNLFGINNIN